MQQSDRSSTVGTVDLIRMHGPSDKKRNCVTLSEHAHYLFTNDVIRKDSNGALLNFRLLFSNISGRLMEFGFNKQDNRTCHN